MSSISTSVILRLIASSVKIADRAGDIIRDIMKGGDLQIIDKGINDLQTEADRSVQRCILASLHKQFPNVTVIGEEEPEAELDPDWIELSMSSDVLAFESQLSDDLKSVKEDNICVWVDPLDGTNEYTKGLLDHVTVLIGIAVDGKAVAGVMHQPYHNYEAGSSATLGRTIWGIVGLGAFGFERRSHDPPRRIIVTTQSHETEITKKAVAACDPSEVIRVGGAGHKVMLLIEGKVDAYLFASPGCKKWDTCAPEAVLRSVGGMLTDVHGNELRYNSEVSKTNSGGIVATGRSADHDWYIGRLPEEVKDALPAS